jgi:hypothetical protein
VSDWNSEPWCNVSIHQTMQATVAGGLSSVAKFIEATGDDLVVVLSKFRVGCVREVMPTFAPTSLGLVPRIRRGSRARRIRRG